MKIIKSASYKRSQANGNVKCDRCYEISFIPDFEVNNKHLSCKKCDGELINLENEYLSTGQYPTIPVSPRFSI